jgi:hypothetical protein
MSIVQPHDAVMSHMETHVGAIIPPSQSRGDHSAVNIHIIAPTQEDPAWTLFTTGMSIHPMLIPAEISSIGGAGKAVPNRIELILRVHASDWPQDAEIQVATNSAVRPWPLRWLTHLAAVPTEHRTWLGASHTIPNGDSRAGALTPLAPNTALSCWLLLPPSCLPIDADVIETSVGPVALLSMVAIYQDEMDYQLQHGADALISKLNALEIDDTMSLDRRSSVLEGELRFGK